MDESTSLKAIVGVSLASITFGLHYLYSHYTEKHFHQSMKQLRKKIRKNWKNNPTIEKLDVKCENTLPLKTYGDIQFFVKVIASEKFAKSKDVRPSEAVPVPPVSAPTAKFDPFAKEHCSKIYIESLSETHALLYNKFPLVPFHVLVVTKEFEKQMSLISEADFEAALKVMKALDCFVFFNGGPNAGASQEHKHLQAIPYSSFPNQTIPLDALIAASKSPAEDSEDVEYTTIPPFKFKHVLCKFRVSILFDLSYGNISKRAKLLHNIYSDCLKRLNNEDLGTAYNFILTKHWLFMVLRKCEVALNMVKINAVGFTGSFAVRSDQEYEFIRRQDPINILRSVTFPTCDN